MVWISENQAGREKSWHGLDNPSKVLINSCISIKPHQILIDPYQIPTKSLSNPDKPPINPFQIHIIHIKSLQTTSKIPLQSNIHLKSQWTADSPAASPRRVRPAASPAPWLRGHGWRPRCCRGSAPRPGSYGLDWIGWESSLYMIYGYEKITLSLSLYI